ncbi:lysophospholipid acyltransferase family protein [Glacieibacterium frigidum]|uniref:lysophospholipid acyltransferase family protein n=1 Tax=Glacieibacterium frigidum TaxID=2593303 RepID=UPI00163D728B|nr:lysophospholipid acyltransferase family protein [Glacieibacterium frigidum]
MHGRPARQGGILFVSNHVSWADIPVLGSLVQAAFVAKSDVEQIKVVGWLASLQRTLYVERDRRQASGEQRTAIAERLQARENVILFPEATTGDGVAVLPFKSALFAAVGDDPALVIQPVTVAYTRLNGMPITRETLPDIVWIGDTDLIPHAVEFTALGRVRAEVVFHPAVRMADFADRKALSRHCREVIAAEYLRLMRGFA